MPGNRTLSVLLPAWNEGEGLVRLAESLLRFPEVTELIVVDDASGDDTIERWRASAVARDPRVVFRQNEKRLGLACSILQALRLAKGSGCSCATPTSTTTWKIYQSSSRSRTPGTISWWPADIKTGFRKSAASTTC